MKSRYKRGKGAVQKKQPRKEEICRAAKWVEERPNFSILRSLAKIISLGSSSQLHETSNRDSVLVKQPNPLHVTKVMGTSVSSLFCPLCS